MIKKHTTHKEKKKEKSDEMFHAKAFPNFWNKEDFTNFWNTAKKEMCQKRREGIFGGF